MAAEDEAARLPRPALRALVADILRAAGVDPAQTDSVAANLAWNEAAGRANHGVERLPILLRRVATGLIRCPAPVAWLALGPSLAHLDAGDAFGQHAGLLATDHACDLAAETGIGLVGVAHSNFFGTGAYFAARAAERGMVSLVLSNSFPKVAAAGGHSAVLGTNPLAFGAPRADGRALLVDFSTAGLAGSTVRAAQRAGTPLPKGLAVDAEGRPITDPDTVAAGTLLPAAGAKGFGLALMVEVLAGVLTGAGIGRDVGSLYRDFGRPGDSGHAVLAVDPGRWMSAAAFEDRMAALDGMVRVDPGVRLPGAARWDALAEAEARGVPLTDASLSALRKAAADHDVPLPAMDGA